MGTVAGDGDVRGPLEGLAWRLLRSGVVHLIVRVCVGQAQDAEGAVVAEAAASAEDAGQVPDPLRQLHHGQGRACQQEEPQRGVRLLRQAAPCITFYCISSPYHVDCELVYNNLPCPSSTT